MGDTIKAKLVYESELPDGSKLVIRVEPKGFVEGTGGGVDEDKLMAKLMDGVEEMVGDKLDSRLSCLRGTLQGAERSAEEAADQAQAAQSEVETALCEIGDESARDTLVSDIAEALRDRIREFTRKSE
jgi:hypothetical protein